MADTKITALTENTNPLTTDVMVMVDDPAGTPVTNKVTIKNLLGSRELASIVPAANFSLAASTSDQNAFPTSGDVFTLEGLTSYMFEGQYFIDKAGTTCQTSMGFSLAGGASVTSLAYNAHAANAAKNTAVAVVSSAWIDTVTTTVLNATAATAVMIRFNGIIRMNAGGTLTPLVKFSAAPTTPVMQANSYIKFTKIGSNTDNVFGSVA